MRYTLYGTQVKLRIETKPAPVIWAVRNVLLGHVLAGIDEE